VDTLQAEFGVPGSVEIYQAVVLRGGAFFDRHDRFIGYAGQGHEFIVAS